MSNWENVLWVLDMGDVSLLSFSSLDDNGYELHSTNGMMTIHSGNTCIMAVRKEGSQFVPYLEVVPPMKEKAMRASTGTLEL